MDILSIKHGIMMDLSTDVFTSLLIGHVGGESTIGSASTHSFGFSLSGPLEVTPEGGHTLPLTKGMYFSLPGEVKVRGDGQCIIAQKIGHRGLASWGGPIEEIGRLCYIDNCMTTVLVSPPRFGDPCLNLLTFPADTKQSQHIHPSLRFGIVIGGEGDAVCFNRDRHRLDVGKAFHIPRGEPHSFHSGRSGLKILAYHPDSDFGPTDQSNPMLNRTYVNY